MSQQTEACTFHGPVDSAEQHKEATIYQQNYQHQVNVWSPNTPNLYNNVWYIYIYIILYSILFYYII